MIAASISAPASTVNWTRDSTCVVAYVVCENWGKFVFSIVVIGIGSFGRLMRRRIEMDQRLKTMHRVKNKRDISTHLFIK